MMRGGGAPIAPHLRQPLQTVQAELQFIKFWTEKLIGNYPIENLSILAKCVPDLDEIGQ
jgi:hypothetical protein